MRETMTGTRAALEARFMALSEQQIKVGAKQHLVATVGRGRCYLVKEPRNKSRIRPRA